jgi:hypothetical protein
LHQYIGAINERFVTVCQFVGALLLIIEQERAESGIKYVGFYKENK